MHKTVRKVLRAVADYDPDYFDMYADAAEAVFARLYVERVLRHASAAPSTSTRASNSARAESTYPVW